MTVQTKSIVSVVPKCNAAREGPRQFEPPYVMNAYFTAYGFTGEPTPPVIGSAGAQNMNS